jgi:hypothetical protein
VLALHPFQLDLLLQILVAGDAQLLQLLFNAL